MSRTLPNLGLTAFFALGEDAWDDDMSLNLLRLSVLVQGRALSKVSATPGSPTDGDVHIFDETHPTQANKVAIRDDGTWVYVTPLEGWLLYNLAEGYYEQFSGAAWAEFSTGGGGGGLTTLSTVVATDADNYTISPADKDKYIRLTGVSAKTIDIALEATTALPANGEWHFRNAGAGDATVTPVGGVTVNVPAGGSLVFAEGGTVTLKRVAEDEFDLLGQTVAA